MPSVTLNGADAAIGLLQSLGREGAVALRQATNDTTRYGRTLLVRSVTGSLNLKPSYVRQRVDIKLAQGGELRAEIRTRKRDVLLERFGAKQLYARAKKGSKRKRTGVSVKVKASGARIQMSDAFFVTLKTSGVRALAYREMDAQGNATDRKYGSKGGRSGRHAIDVLYGPSVYQHFKLRLPEIRDELSGKFLDEAKRQYQRRLPR